MGLNERARLEGAAAGLVLPEGQSLQSTLQRGWYFGREEFREKLLALAEQALRSKSKDHNFAGAPEVKAHSQSRAEQLVARGLEVCALKREDLSDLPKGDKRKALIALAVKRETTVPMRWIALTLGMGTPSTVSREAAVMAKELSLSPASPYAQIHKRIIADT